MTEEFEVNGRKYRLKPLKPAILPYLQLWGDLMTKKPKDLEEARKISEEIESLQMEIFKMSVEPIPPDEDALDVMTQISLAVAGKVSKGEELGRKFRRKPPSTAGPGDLDITT